MFRIPFGDDTFAILDEDDWLRLRGYSWHRTAGYPSRKVNGKVVYMHQDVIGRAPDGLVTDHISGDKLDNRKANLRHVTQRENLLNRLAVINAKYIYKHRQRFVFRIQIDKKLVTLGSFLTEAEAIVARDQYLGRS